MENHVHAADGLLRLHRGRDAPVRRGHPWVFDGAIAEVEGSPVSGDVVEVADGSGAFVAWAFYSSNSLIRARCISRREDDFPNEQLVRRLLHTAWALRQRHGFTASAGVRIVNAEGDFLPGLIIDLYGATASVQFHHPWTERYREVIRRFAMEHLEASVVIDRSQRAARLREGLAQSQGVMGGIYENHPQIREHGVSFVVDAQNGQKTGFYLDQRANRALARRWAAGRRVLDLFAYTGGFGLAALGAGAPHSTFVESGSSAVELLRQNLELNNVPSGRCTVVHGEVEHFLATASGSYDLIIFDPPPMARRKAHVDAARRGMGVQLDEVLRLAAPDALLLLFSCSHHLGEEDLEAAMAAASAHKARPVRILQRLDADEDHPSAAGHPEGRYLRGLLVHVGDAH